MRRIAITPPDIATDESEMIKMILDRGWNAVHLRHPSATRREMQTLIEKISQKYHCRLRLHGHFDLLNDFNLGGIHLNARCPEAPRNYSGPTSRSCHNPSEAAACTECDYVTLSPVFDSISKHGYRAASFDLSLLRGLTYPKIIALGGVTPERCSLLDCSVFDGYAVLGYLFSDLPDDWQSELGRRLDRFEQQP